MIPALYPPIAVLAGRKWAPATPGGLLAEYRFDEGSGTTLADHSGSSNDGTLGYPGGFLPTWTSTGLRFDSAVVQLPTAMYNAARSWLFWITPDPAGGVVLGHDNDSPGLMWLRSNSLQPMFCQAVNPTAEGTRPLVGPAGLAYTIGTPDRIYVNGAEVAGYAVQGDLGLGTATDRVFLGLAASIFYAGSMHYALAYSGVLSPSDMARAHAYVAGKLAARGVPIAGGERAPTLAFEGDSRTAGLGGDYPSAVAAALAPGRRWSNLGLGGRTMAAIASERLALAAQAGASGPACVIWAGTNDLANGTGQGPSVRSAISTYATALRAAGIKVVACTEIDRSAAFSGQTGAGFRSDLAALNTWLRANSSGFADALADLDADSRLQDSTNSTYFLDGVHLTPAGYAIVAGIVVAALNSIGVS